MKTNIPLCVLKPESQRLYLSASRFIVSVKKAFAITMIACIASCSRERELPVTNGTELSSDRLSMSNDLQNTEQAVSPYISVGNNVTNKLEVYRYSSSDWTTTSSKEWIFAPTTALGFTATGSTYFKGSLDAKVRNNAAFSNATSVVAICDHRWAGLAVWEGSSPRGTKLWGKFWDNSLADPSIHSCELLPNGNIALAAAKGDWVRVYSTVGSGNYAQFNIDFAHAALWDPAISRLWINGVMYETVNGVVRERHLITALIVGGTRESPTLTEDVSRRSIMPEGQWPHDISPVYGLPDKLYVSNNYGVYAYTKSTKSFVRLTGDAFHQNVKGISNQAGGGVIVETQAPGNTGSTARSSSVYFFDPHSGNQVGSRTVPGAGFYKGKVFTRPYQ